jgi:predicted nucleic acid-binding protein
MPLYYLEPNALIKRYVQEPGTAWLRTMIDHAAPGTLVTSRLGRIEVIAALSRLQKARPGRASELAQLVHTFRRDVAERLRVMRLTDTLLERADAVAVTHGLRAYDAVHLASAMELRGAAAGEPGVEIVIVSADEEVLTAARVERFGIANPLSHPDPRDLGPSRA